MKKRILAIILIIFLILLVFAYLINSRYSTFYLTIVGIEDDRIIASEFLLNKEYEVSTNDAIFYDNTGKTISKDNLNENDKVFVLDELDFKLNSAEIKIYLMTKLVLMKNFINFMVFLLKIY